MSEESHCELPSSWKWVELEELGHWSGGGTPSKGNSVFWSDGNIPWVSPKDMKSFAIHDTEDHITDDAVLGSSTSIVPVGAVLMVTRSGILRHTFPVAVLHVPAALNQDLKALLPHDGLSPKFIAYALRCFGRQILHGCAKDGTTVQSIESMALKRFQIPLAPECEQTRIADTLDELLSDLDAGVAALEQVQAKLKLYRASVLKAAVEGTLTADWRAQHPDVEPASELLQRILVERRRRWEKDQLHKFKEKGKVPPKDWKTKYKEPVTPDTSALPELPEGWCWTSLGECFRVQVGATPSRTEQSYWNGDVAWVASGEVQFCRIADTRERITDLALKNSSTTLNPVGSVILNMIGEGRTRGKAGILDIAACNNQNCAAIWVSHTPIPTLYVYYWLLYQYEQTRELGSGNNQPAMNKTIVEGIPLPLPPLIEQEAIVETLDDQMSIIDHLEADLAAKFQSAQALRQSILRHAFKGKLVPQDPNDEPASELLKRIEAERAARTHKGAAAKKSGNSAAPPAKRGRKPAQAKGAKP